MGGRTVAIAVHAPGAWTDVDATFSSPAKADAWLIAVRPDKVVMDDGAPAELASIIESVARLLR